MSERFDNIEKELKEVGQKKRFLNNLTSTIQFYEDKLTAPSTTSFTKDKVQSSGENKREQMLVELADFKIEYDELLVETLRKETSIYKAINRLDVEEQNIIIEKYIHGKTWYKVAKNYNYSDRQIYRKRNNILQKLARLEHLFKNL